MCPGRRTLLRLAHTGELSGERRDLSTKLRALRLRGVQLPAKLSQLCVGDPHRTVVSVVRLRAAERAPGADAGEREHSARQRSPWRFGGARWPLSCQPLGDLDCEPFEIHTCRAPEPVDVESGLVEHLVQLLVVADREALLE
jgi:hypothetical protein